MSGERMSPIKAGIAALEDRIAELQAEVTMAREALDLGGQLAKAHEEARHLAEAEAKEARAETNRRIAEVIALVRSCLFGGEVKFGDTTDGELAAVIQIAKDAKRAHAEVVEREAKELRREVERLRGHVDALVKADKELHHNVEPIVGIVRCGEHGDNLKRMGDRSLPALDASRLALCRAQGFEPPESTTARAALGKATP